MALKKKNSSLYTGTPGVLDNSGTLLIEKRQITKDELCIVKSIDAYSYKLRDALPLIISWACLIMGTIFLMITKKYEYSYVLGGISIFFIYSLIRIKPIYNDSLNFVNVICGNIIFDEKNQTYYIGELKINNSYYELIEKNKNKKKVIAAIATLEAPHSLVSINDELMSYKRNYDRLHMLLTLLISYGVMVGIFSILNKISH